MQNILPQVSQKIISLSPVDMAIIAIYFAMVIIIGFYLKRFSGKGEGFFLAGREMSAWVAGLAFISANLGALELMGWASASYQYGILAAHWYWVGAIPAILFLGIVMMPFYHISKTHSVPGFLKLRYGEAARGFNAISFAFMFLLMSGINMYAMALVMKVVLGWDINFSIWVAAITVAIYVTLGGLYSAVFNEVMQFFLIWFGALLVPIFGLIETHGWHGMVLRIQQNIPQIFPPETFPHVHGSFTHLWSGIGSFATNPMGIHWTGIVLGLGFVISFGYWTTDFLVVQRVLTAKDLRSAKLAPIIGSFFKMAVPFIVILPGLLGLALLNSGAHPIILHPENALKPGDHSFNEVLPLMLARYCGPGLLGLGITALMAGFMSGMAGEISAFTTVWTYDIYRSYVKKGAQDSHYVWMGRISTILGVLISICTAYLVMHFKSIMDYVQALFSFFVAPLFGTVLLGMLWKRATPAGGFWGLLAGTLSSIGMWALVKFHSANIVINSLHINAKPIAIIALSNNASDMAQNMYRALWSWIVCVSVTIIVSLVTRPKPVEELTGLVYGCTELPSEAHLPLWKRPIFYAAIAIVLFLVLQIIFW
ncbi:MAG: sodium:solute symporter family protein [Chitinispirillaceae bacterium]|jgi:SSS family solute:Na+ symporter